MTRTRWKLMAGVLGLSLSGLAVVASVPNRNGCQRQCGPETQVAATPASGAIAVAVARTAPQQPPVELPPPAAPVPVPPVPAQEVVGRRTVGLVSAGAPVPVPPVPAPLELPIPAKVTTPGEFPVIPAAASEKPKEAPKPDPKPTQPVPAPVTLPEITPVIPAAASATPGFTIPPQPTPTPVEVKPVVPQPVQPTLPTIEPQAPRIEPTALPAPQPQPRPEPLPAAEPMSAEKKLKVILHMGDERPRFEVRDGDEVYLKVLCERVEVKSPSDRGETMSTLRAAGRVAFVTPGGEGLCDELTVVPGTGQVLVTGKVSFKYNWGKVETTVSGDRMVFRLGTAPSMPQPTSIPASYQKSR